MKSTHADWRANQAPIEGEKCRNTLCISNFSQRKAALDLPPSCVRGFHQRFPSRSLVSEEVDDAKGKNYAVIVDEAHSSQTGSSALKLKTAMADTEDALREYAEIEGIKTFSDIYFSYARQDAKAMGKMTSALKLVADNKKSADER